MNGLLYVIDKLGQALAQAEADVTRLSAENEALHEALRELAPETPKEPAT